MHVDNLVSLTREYSRFFKSEDEPEIGVVGEGFLDNIFVLDATYTTKAIIDVFKSIVWTERYDEAGEFELVVPASKKTAQEVRLHDYLSIKESSVIMIIETVTLETDVANGDMLVYSGRSLESILDRRIVWGMFEKSEETNFQDVVEEVLNDNFINPKNPKRKIPGFQFKRSEDPEITKLMIEVKMMGDNIYEWICASCKDRKIGWRVNAISDGGFEFELYRGVDRSWDQTEEGAVVFSDSYENLLSSNYIQSEVNYKTNAFVRGDDDNITMEVQRQHDPERTGLDRREVYIDTNQQPDEYMGIPMYDQSYYDQMLNSVKETMTEYEVTTAFDSEVDWTRQFIFDKDYFVGDIVQVENRYGFMGKCRVSEIVKTRNSSGPSMVPTFIVVDLEDEITKGD